VAYSANSETTFPDYVLILPCYSRWLKQSVPRVVYADERPIMLHGVYQSPVFDLGTDIVAYLPEGDVPHTQPHTDHPSDYRSESVGSLLALDWTSCAIQTDTISSEEALLAVSFDEKVSVDA
jgi:hypothetical protein